MSNPPNAAVAAVYVSPYDDEARFRQVRIVRPDNTVVAEPCASQAAFEALVAQHRPGTDLHNPGQVYWVDRPGEWSGI